MRPTLSIETMLSSISVSLLCTLSFTVQPYRATSLALPLWPVLAIPDLDQIYQFLSYPCLVLFSAQLTLPALAHSCPSRPPSPRASAPACPTPPGVTLTWFRSVIVIWVTRGWEPLKKFLQDQQDQNYQDGRHFELTIHHKARIRKSSQKKSYWS